MKLTDRVADSLDVESRYVDQTSRAGLVEFERWWALAKAVARGRPDDYVLACSHCQAPYHAVIPKPGYCRGNCKYLAKLDRNGLSSSQGKDS